MERRLKLMKNKLENMLAGILAGWVATDNWCSVKEQGSFCCWDGYCRREDILCVYSGTAADTDLGIETSRS